LSLPISTIASIAAATRLAQGIAGGVSEAMGFHEILTADESANPSELLNRLTDAIRGRLVDAGIDVNQVPEISLMSDGAIRVEGRHQQAAEIESILNADQEIRSLSERSVAASGAGDLTIRLADANIRDNLS